MPQPQLYNYVPKSPKMLNTEIYEFGKKPLLLHSNNITSVNQNYTIIPLELKYPYLKYAWAKK